MLKILIVGTGGFLGSVLRYLLGGWVHQILESPWFPCGTLAVNLLGCLFIGFLGGISETRNVFSPETRMFLFLGVLGGFTTFSSFGFETFMLARDGETWAMVSNIALQVVFGLGAVWCGNMFSRFL